MCSASSTSRAYSGRFLYSSMILSISIAAVGSSSMPPTKTSTSPLSHARVLSGQGATIRVDRDGEAAATRSEGKTLGRRLPADGSPPSRAGASTSGGVRALTGRVPAPDQAVHR